MSDAITTAQREVLFILYRYAKRRPITLEAIAKKRAGSAKAARDSRSWLRYLRSTGRLLFRLTRDQFVIRWVSGRSELTPRGRAVVERRLEWEKRK